MDSALRTIRYQATNASVFEQSAPPLVVECDGAHRAPVGLPRGDSLPRPQHLGHPAEDATIAQGHLAELGRAFDTGSVIDSRHVHRRVAPLDRSVLRFSFWCWPT